MVRSHPIRDRSTFVPLPAAASRGTMRLSSHLVFTRGDNDREPERTVFEGPKVIPGKETNNESLRLPRIPKLPQGSRGRLRARLESPIRERAHLLRRVE